MNVWSAWMDVQTDLEQSSSMVLFSPFCSRMLAFIDFKWSQKLAKSAVQNCDNSHLKQYYFNKNMKQNCIYLTEFEC